MVVIVKRKGHKEKFDENKVYESIYAACISAHYNKKVCENLSRSIAKKVKMNLKNIKQITSNKISILIEKELKKINEELAFFYEKHIPNLKSL